jgi:zinc-ribbon domain
MNPLRWRKMTWAIVIFSVLMLIWVIAGVASNPSVSDAEIADCMQGDLFTEDECRDTLEAAGDVGTGIGVALIIFLWFFGFIILSIIWFMSRPKHRQCPACGTDVKKGQTKCPSCGHDFVAALQTAPAQGPPPAAPPPPAE